MKKTLLALLLGSAGLGAQGQVILNVLEPANIAGSYSFTWADPGGGWGSPDLNDPLNAVTDTLALATDGTAADSLCCNPLTNGPDVAGKIAVIYRGDCEFGAKALNAQNAGAVAVFIINRVAGAPVAMGAGAQGANVTIPVAMITLEDGIEVEDELEAGTPVVAFLGSINNFFQYNLSAYRPDVLVAPASGQPALVSQNASEFSVELGVWIHNYGTADQPDASLNAKVEQNGTVLYDQTSTGTAIASGDSLFVTLPPFSQASYTDALYTVTYSISSGSFPDEFMADNSFTFTFRVDSVLSYAPIDPLTGKPTPNAHYRPGDDLDGFQSCIHFQNANASRMAATGIYTSATTATGTTLDGEFIGVRAYEWADSFTGLSDPNFPAQTAYTLVEEATGEYYYQSDLQGEVVFVPFQDPLVLLDNTRYLFCVYTLTDAMFVGYDASLDYDEHTTLYDQPVSLIEDGGTWFNVGFGTDVTSAIGVEMIPAGNIGINELNSVDVTPYPNPTTDMIRVPLAGLTGAADLRIMDQTGKLVADRRVNIANEVLVLDVTGLSGGTYQFALNFQDGGRTTFRVVVTK